MPTLSLQQKLLACKVVTMHCFKLILCLQLLINHMLGTPKCVWSCKHTSTYFNSASTQYLTGILQGYTISFVVQAVLYGVGLF